MDMQPFPIADFQMGMFAGREPWLSPRAAFRELTNGRIYRGRLEKRRGYSRLSELGVAAATKNGTGTGANWNTIYSTFSIEADGRISNMIPETAVFQWEDASAGTLEARLRIATYPVDPDSGDVDPTYGIDVVDAGTGNTVIGSWLDVVSGFAVTWNAHPDYTGAGPNRGTLDYYAPHDKPCLGISSFKSVAGVESILAFDQDNAYVFDDTVQAFKKDTSTYTLSGDDQDLFWTWPFDNYMMVTNGVDPVLKYTPGGSPTIEEIDSEFDSGSAGNDLDTCLMVIRFKGRAVFLNTTENGTRFPRRARWSIAGSFETHDTTGLGFADAPSHLGSIVTAQFIADRLFVGFELGWMELVDTQTDSPAFKWEVTTARHGAVAKMGTIQDSHRLIARSEYAMEAIDPTGQYEVDVAIPDFIRDLDASQRGMTAAARNDAYHALWWTYARSEDSSPSRILSGQYDPKGELSWSVHTLPMLCFGGYSGSSIRTWDSFSPRSWDSLTFSWDSVRGESGYRTLLGGLSNGTVVAFDASDSDLREPIELVATSQGLAPFPGQVARLGWIDIYARATSDAVLTVGWTPNDRLSIAKSVTVNLTPEKLTDKVYRRVLVNRSAVFHKLRLSISGSAFVAIDAIVPWFSAVGRVRRFG